MTKKRKTELVVKFLSWLAKKKCKATIETVECRRTTVKTCSVVQMVGGKPANTICFETFPRKTSDEDCWAEVLERRCGKKLLFDRFGMFGLGDADTLEELELKLEVAAV